MDARQKPFRGGPSPRNVVRPGSCHGAQQSRPGAQGEGGHPGGGASAPSCFAGKVEVFARVVFCFSSTVLCVFFHLLCVTTCFAFLTFRLLLCIPSAVQQYAPIFLFFFFPCLCFAVTDLQILAGATYSYDAGVFFCCTVFFLPSFGNVNGNLKRKPTWYEIIS